MAAQGAGQLLRKRSDMAYHHSVQAPSGTHETSEEEFQSPVQVRPSREARIKCSESLHSLIPLHTERLRAQS